MNTYDRTFFRGKETKRLGVEQTEIGLSHLSDGADDGEAEGLLEGCELGGADGKEVGEEVGLRRERDIEVLRLGMVRYCIVWQILV